MRVQPFALLLCLIACRAKPESAALRVHGPGEDWRLRTSRIVRDGVGASGVDEWQHPQGEGVEQGWTFPTRPAGDGAIWIDVDAWTAGATGRPRVTVTPDGRQASISQGAHRLEAGGLAAWDADGQAIPARFEVAPGGLRICVDDTLARYPLTVDPVYTSAAQTLTSGNARDGFGMALAHADVNGDGLQDVIVGAPQASGAAPGDFTGAVRVYLGTSSGLDGTPATTFVGPRAGEYFGEAVASLGDVNADGYEDVVIGSYGSGFEGRAGVYLGSAVGLTSASIEYAGDAPNEEFAITATGVGDVNGDGYGDAAFNELGYDHSAGRVSLYFGSATGLPASPSQVFAGASAQEYFGSDVASAGDVNGDGFGDVVFGAYGWSGFTGQARIHLGSADGLGSSPATTLTGDGVLLAFGGNTTGAGDVNGDGFDDVLVGCIGDPISPVGYAFLYLGSAEGVTDSIATTLAGEGSYNYFGLSEAPAGDVNADGYADVIVGAVRPYAETGRAYVYEGSPEGLSSEAATTLEGTRSGDYYGQTVIGAGDLDGDGYDDVLVANLDSEVRVYYGYPAPDGDTGDTADTGDTNDTAAPPDTADSEDTHPGDSDSHGADSAGNLDDPPHAAPKAAQCGCSTNGGSDSVGALGLLGLLTIALRRPQRILGRGREAGGGGLRR